MTDRTPSRDLDDREISALLDGTLRNAFGVLGLHSAGNGCSRAAFFAPGADRVWLVDESDHELVELSRRHEDGVFSTTRAPERLSGWRYLVETGGQREYREDPYRFPSLLRDDDVWLFSEGKHYRAWQFLGAHFTSCLGVEGTHFAVWAPNATRVAVMGDFNAWDERVHVLRFHPGSGIWEMFVPGPGPGNSYHFVITTREGRRVRKADPYARRMQDVSDVAAVIEHSDYRWGDGEWTAARKNRNHHESAISVYEVHLDSWRRHDGRFRYAEANALLDYVSDMGFTHLQFMPIAEYPFGGSWGYQPLGLYAPTIRYGEPDELRTMIDAAHQRGIGVLLDWVPAHFPSDEHGLAHFDGTALYEHEDPRLGLHPDWNTLIYNFGRAEVVNFLISNAVYWLEAFHIDGLRMDAVASMLYLDYSRPEGEWLPNRHGGRENLEAIEFLKRVNDYVAREFPGALMIAEESTAFPGVTAPTHHGGLGFTHKWNMGWMHDTLEYMKNDPINRRYHHGQMTFSLVYAFSEQYILPLSHDEVVHGKASLLSKMPGDRWQQFANLRALFGFMWAHPGKKLLFMGGELGQWREWDHDGELDWNLLDYDEHQGVQRLVRDLNRLYARTDALHRYDGQPRGFEWLDVQNADESVLAFRRQGEPVSPEVYVVANLTPVVRHGYELHVATPLIDNVYFEILNTDHPRYGGSGVLNEGELRAATNADGTRLSLTLPPLGVIFLSRGSE